MAEFSFNFLKDEAQLAALNQLIVSLDKQECIGLDTEFIRDVSYYPRLCLMQLWLKGQGYLVDPLCLNLKPLMEALDESRALLLIYSGSEDFETIVQLRRSFGLPAAFKTRCLDLQVFISMLNLGYRLGLAGAVKIFLGYELLKNETRSDWAERPLSAAQLEYAVLDVLYLERLYHQLLARSNAEQLQLAFAETNEQLLSACEILDPQEAYLYIDKSANLRPAALKRLQFLAQQRLEYARNIDEAVNRVITTSAMARIADSCPNSLKALAACNMKWGAIREHGSEVLKWVKQAETLPEDPALKRPLAYYLHAREYHDVLRRLKFELQQAAARSQICAELLTQKKLLADYLFCKQYGLCPRLKQGWRARFAQHLD